MTRKMNREVVTVAAALAILGVFTYISVVPSPNDNERLGIARCNQAITVYEQTGKYISTFGTACPPEVKSAIQGTYKP